MIEFANKYGSYGYSEEDVQSFEELGVKLARDCRWDGEAILTIAHHALVDANFHIEARIIRQIDSAQPAAAAYRKNQQRVP